MSGKIISSRERIMFEKISIWGRRRNIKGMGVDQLVIELEERGQAHVTSERTVFVISVREEVIKKIKMEGEGPGF